MPVHLLPMAALMRRKLRLESDNSKMWSLIATERYNSLGKAGAATLKSYEPREVLRRNTYRAKAERDVFLLKMRLGNFYLSEKECPETGLQKKPMQNMKNDSAKVTVEHLRMPNLDITQPDRVMWLRKVRRSHFFAMITLFMEPSENPYATSVVYTDSPLSFRLPSPFKKCGKGWKMVGVVAEFRSRFRRIMGFADNMNSSILGWTI